MISIWHESCGEFAIKVPKTEVSTLKVTIKIEKEGIFQGKYGVVYMFHVFGTGKVLH